MLLFLHCGNNTTHVNILTVYKKTFVSAKYINIGADRILCTYLSRTCQQYPTVGKGLCVKVKARTSGISGGKAIGTHVLV